MVTSNTLRDRRSEAGFSLVELCVVLVVVSVLLGIAVPMFLGARDRASDAAAKARATDGLKAHAAVVTNLVEVTDARYLPALRAAEPSVRFAVLADPGAVVQGVVYVRAEDARTATLVARSADGDCYWVRDRNGAKAYARTACTEPTAGDFAAGW